MIKQTTPARVCTCKANDSRHPAGLHQTHCQIYFAWYHAGIVAPFGGPSFGERGW